MTDSNTRESRAPAVIGLIALVILGAGAWWFFEDRSGWPRGEALDTALKSLIDRQNADQSLVARVILDSYAEARANASRWSGVYWGFTFAAAVFSALAGLILKFETILKSESLKKDVAAILSVSAAIMITVSTSGDFQRKWQANRVAAAELERAGYELLQHDGADARSYLETVGRILLKRHLSIVGNSEEKRTPPASKKAE